MNRVKEMLIRHEGLRLKPYVDTVGKLSIGVGRNLDDVGISELEAMVLLDNDIRRVHREVECFDWLSNLDSVRQDVVVMMVFNLGLGGFKGFRKFIECLRVQDYEGASREMLDSLWSKQVGNRAIELSRMMRTGRY